MKDFSIYEFVAACLFIFIYTCMLLILKIYKNKMDEFTDFKFVVVCVLILVLLWLYIFFIIYMHDCGLL